MDEKAKKLMAYGFSPMLLIVAAVILLIMTGAMYVMCFETIDPGMIGIVMQKRGKTDPAGHFIVEKGFKGTQREVLMPGLHFFWQTTMFMDIAQVPMTVIPAGKVGVLIAQDGRDLAEGVVLADDDEVDPDSGKLIKMGQKGIRKSALEPGTYPINTQYFTVETYDALNVESGMVGVLTRKIGEPAPEGQILVPLDSPYRGIIKEILEPGIRYVHPKIYSWEVVEALNIPAGKVGILTRKIGEPAPSGDILVSFNSNYRGIIKEILEPGLRYLHPKMYSWDVVDAIVIPAGSVGVLTRKVGKTPPAGTILVERASDYQGIIRDVVEPGIHYLNSYEFQVEIKPAINIPDGFVGVMVAKTGKPAPGDQQLVEEGFRGVRQEYLKPGLYYINPYEFDIVPVETRKQKYEMTYIQNESDTTFQDDISFLSNDGFKISVDVTIVYQIQPENAPFVVATIGKDLEDVKAKVIRPGSRSFARLEGSMLKAVDFVKGETRKTFQDKLAAALITEGERAKITVVNTFVRSYIIPEELLQPIRTKEIAQKQTEQLIEEQKREEEQAKLARQHALVDQQSQKIKAETEKIVAETKAQQDKEVAIVKGEQMLAVAKLDREAAEQEKLRQIALGEGEAKRRQLLIQADNLEELRLQIYKEIMVRFASEIGKQKWVPDMVVGGGANGSGGNLAGSITDVLNMLSVLVANQLHLPPSGQNAAKALPPADVQTEPQKQ